MFRIEEIIISINLRLNPWAREIYSNSFQSASQASELNEKMAFNQTIDYRQQLADFDVGLWPLVARIKIQPNKKTHFTAYFFRIPFIHFYSHPIVFLWIFFGAEKKKNWNKCFIHLMTKIQTNEIAPMRESVLASRDTMTTWKVKTTTCNNFITSYTHTSSFCIHTVVITEPHLGISRTHHKICNCYHLFANE